jgi:hypothetical protein
VTHALHSTPCSGRLISAFGHRFHILQGAGFAVPLARSIGVDARAATFHPGYPMPFSAPARPIDGVGDTSGAAQTVKKRRANAANNYFCAQWPAAFVTQNTLRKLQTAVKAIPNVPHGAHGRLPQSRKPLHDIGGGCPSIHHTARVYSCSAWSQARPPPRRSLTRV